MTTPLKPMVGYVIESEKLFAQAIHLRQVTRSEESAPETIVLRGEDFFQRVLNGDIRVNHSAAFVLGHIEVVVRRLLFRQR